MALSPVRFSLFQLSRVISSVCVMLLVSSPCVALSHFPVMLLSSFGIYLFIFFIHPSVFTFYTDFSFIAVFLALFCVVLWMCLCLRQVYGYIIALEIKRVHLNTSNLFLSNELSQPFYCTCMYGNLQLLVLQTCESNFVIKKEREGPKIFSIYVI